MRLITIKDIEWYTHHGQRVAVRKLDRGQHRDHCLCYDCDKWQDDDGNTVCPIAKAVYANCVEHGIVTPVWECPEFESADDTDQ